jgi:hypothetical protein
MPPPNPAELLAAAQSRVGDVRALLARPRDCRIEECVTLFREAQGYLEWLRDSLPPSAPAPVSLRPKAIALAAEIRQLKVLIDRAALLGGRWLAALQPVSLEYSASGSRPRLRVSGVLSYTG